MIKYSRFPCKKSLKHFSRARGVWMVTHHYVIINFTYKKSSKHQLVEVQKLYDFLNTHDHVIAFLSMSSFYTCCESLHSILNMPNSVIDLGQTPSIFEWYVVKCDSENIYQTNMFKRNKTLRSKMISILSSIVEHKWGSGPI